MNEIDDGTYRTFASGATRNSSHSKLDFEGFLSAPVIEAYARYMNKHRKQKDGTLRASDNWQKLFGENHYDVCAKSAWRHFFEFWKAHRGYKTKASLEDSAMGVLFNIMAYMHKRLQDHE